VFTCRASCSTRAGVTSFTFLQGRLARARGVIAGEVSIGFNSLASVLPHMRSGKVKVLAVLEANRYPGLPQVPSIGEFVPGFEKPAPGSGLFGPGALPAPVIARLHEEIVKSLKERE